LTETAVDQFPNNLRALANDVLEQVKEIMPPTEVKAMFRRIASHTAEEAPVLKEHQSLEERLTEVVAFLSQKGYLPRWEQDADGRYLLHISNCPYAGVSDEHPELCQMDATLAEILLGHTPQRLSRMADGDLRCTYRIQPSGNNGVND
jgi:predicted ArsR family transcriptional regulator